MKFREYIANRIPKEGEFDTIIGDVYMPATVCLSKNIKFPTQGMEDKYGKLLDANINILNNDVIEVLFDNYKLGEQFCYDMAGYCLCDEYATLTGLE
ncbi:MAG: hypothetical protein RR313_11845 [Anaerovoracaceae bacterium]